MFIGLDMRKAEISASLNGETRTPGPAVCTLLSQRPQAFCALVHSIHPFIHPFLIFSLIKPSDRLKVTPKLNMALTAPWFAEVPVSSSMHENRNKLHQSKNTIMKNGQDEFLQHQSLNFGLT